MTRHRKPINTTIDPATADEIRAKSDATKIPIGTLLEDAWLMLKGEPTPMTLARRQMLFGEPAAKVKRAA